MEPPPSFASDASLLHALWMGERWLDRLEAQHRFIHVRTGNWRTSSALLASFDEGALTLSASADPEIADNVCRLELRLPCLPIIDAFRDGCIQWVTKLGQDGRDVVRVASRRLYANGFHPI